MKDANQPQTTQNPTVRDAAAQISATQGKGKAIYNGANRFFHGDPDAVTAMLANICAGLTSTVKAERENAKNIVRELVKLGNEAAK